MTALPNSTDDRRLLHSLSFLAGVVLLEFVLAALGWWLAPRFANRSIPSLLTEGRFLLTISYGIGGAVAAVVGSLTAYTVLPGYRLVLYRNVIRELKRIPWPQLSIAGLAAAVGEEIFFRGFLLYSIGLVPSALLFGLLHFSSGKSWVYYGLTSAVVGAGFGILVLVTNSLIPAMIAHAGHNLLVILFVFQGFLDLE